MEQPLRWGEQVESVKSLSGSFPAVSLWLLGPSGFHPNISALDPDVWMFCVELTDRSYKVCGFHVRISLFKY